MSKFKFAPPKPQSAVNLGLVPVGKCVTLTLAGKEEQVIVLSSKKDTVLVLMVKAEGVYRTDELSPFIPVKSVVGQFSHFVQSEKKTQLVGLANMIVDGYIDKQSVFVDYDDKKLIFLFGDRSGQSFSKVKDVPLVYVEVFIESVTN